MQSAHPHPSACFPWRAAKRPYTRLPHWAAANTWLFRGDGVLARLDAVTGREVWRLTAVGLGEIQDVQLNSERHDVLLVGKNAWPP
jgi:hypothetical protein